VNLVPDDYPHDIYLEVAEIVSSKVQVDAQYRQRKFGDTVPVFYCVTWICQSLFRSGSSAANRRTGSATQIRTNAQMTDDTRPTRRVIGMNRRNAITQG
jgi:hypothetical protein